MENNNIEQERKIYNDNKVAKALKGVVAPDVTKRKQVRQVINDSAYIVIISLVSLLAIIIPPLVNGCLSSDISMNFPKSVEGWVLWSLLNGGTAIGNVSLLFLFKLQAKKNVRNDANYIKANEILNRLAGRKEVFIPRSPAKMNAQAYSRKILTILVSTIASSVVLTSLVINFDWLTLLSCLLSVLISLCVSWVAMLNDEAYWTEEYLLYAIMMEDKIKHEQEAQETEPEQEQEVVEPQETTE